MYNLSMLIILFAYSSFTMAEENPEILLFERDPWLMVIGSDSPVITIYPSGLTIYWHKSEGNKGAYKAVQLNAEEKKVLAKKVSALQELEKYYGLSNWTDQTTTELFFATNGEMKSISVYGRIKENGDDRDIAPVAFLKIYDYLVSFSHPKAIAWIPKYLEVMIWPYEYAPDKSIVWPKNWPDIKSQSTLARGESFSIYLPYEKKEEFTQFMNTRKEKGAVLINDKKWAVSVRVPFPHEIPVNDLKLQPIR